MANGNPTVGIGALVAGGMLLYAGWHKAGLIDVIRGNPLSDPLAGGSGGSGGTVSATASPSTPGIGVVNPGRLPRGVTQFDGHPVASWIVPILKRARASGKWHGKVTSGYRTAAEQTVAANDYGLQHYGPAGPQGSNHRRTVWPGGAVDVEDPDGLNNFLKSYKGLPSLVWAGPVIGDYAHFSATGH